MKQQFHLTEIENMALLLTLEKQQELIEKQLKPLDEAISRIVEGVAARLGVNPETIRIDPRTGIVTHDTDIPGGTPTGNGEDTEEATQSQPSVDLLVPGDPRMIKAIENSRGRTPKVRA